LFVIKDRRARVIINGESCNNLVSADLIKNLGLTTRPHKNPYYIQWLNNSGKAKVTQTARVHFSLCPYSIFVDYDVVPMQVALFCWVDLGNMTIMLSIMAEVIHILLCIMGKRLLYNP
jgi:hypothetical protein